MKQMHVTDKHPDCQGVWALVDDDGKVKRRFGREQRGKAAALTALTAAWGGWNSLVAAAGDGLEPWKSKALMFVGVPTSDKRQIDDGGVRFRTVPLPLMLQTVTAWGHDGAVICGRIDMVEQTGELVPASGVFDNGPAGQEAVRLIANKMLRGVSVDLGEIDVVTEILDFDEDGWPTDWLDHFTVAEVMGATLTPFPAFAEAAIELENMPAEEKKPEAVTAAVIGEADLPLAERDAEWDAAAAEQSVREMASSDGSGDEDTIDWDQYGRAFLWRDDEADAETFGAYKLGFAEVIDDELRAVPRGVFAVAGVLSGARGGADIPQEDQDNIKERVNAYYAKMREEFDDDSIVPPWESEASDDADAEASTGCHDCDEKRKAGAVRRTFQMTTADIMLPDWDVPVEPPAEWLQAPAEFGPMEFSDDGRVFGGVAEWGTCHIGYANECITPPKSVADYAYYRVGYVRTEEGEDIPTGVLSMGGGHANINHSWQRAKKHYDDATTGFADVAAGEMDEGIWIAGCVRPGFSKKELRMARGSVPSGDWRGIGGNLEMIAVLQVNTPGFPTPRVRTYNGERVALIAAVAPRKQDPDMPDWARELRRDMDRLARVSRVLYPEVERALAARVLG